MRLENADLITSSKDTAQIQVVKTSKDFDIIVMAEKPEWKQLLVDIVQKERMNPWNVDLSLVTQRFMGTIKKMKKLNLRISANVLLAASILLRYKSDTISFQDQEKTEGLPVFIPDSLYQEPVIPRLEAVSRTPKRKVTLEELIGAVEDVMSKEKKKAQKQRQRLNVAIPEPLLEMVGSEEDFEKKLNEIYTKVKKKVDKENMTLFSNVVENKTVENVIGTLVPLLHLANKQRLAMWQEEMFGEIFILLNGVKDSNGKGEVNGGRAVSNTTGTSGEAKAATAGNRTAKAS